MLPLPGDILIVCGGYLIVSMVRDARDSQWVQAGDGRCPEVGGLVPQCTELFPSTHVGENPISLGLNPQHMF